MKKKSALSVHFWQDIGKVEKINFVKLIYGKIELKLY